MKPNPPETSPIDDSLVACLRIFAERGRRIRETQTASPGEGAPPAADDVRDDKEGEA